jgi:proteasome lid subunit RPN8/RPN11
MLTIGAGHYESIRRHGEETYPYECCGALMGTFQENDRVVAKVVRCGNTRVDRPEDRYTIDPRELVRIQREATEQGFEIVGFYHSHPDHPAQWSQTDLAEAHWLGCSYVITSIQKGTAEITNSFVLLGEAEEEKHFANEPIDIKAQMENQKVCP